MSASSRFTTVKCISKRAKVIRIDAENLFARIKRQDVLDMFQNTAINKLKVISDVLKNFQNFRQNRKETIENHKIMERFEDLEPMMMDIYQKSGNKIEAEN